MTEPTPNSAAKTPSPKQGDASRNDASGKSSSGKSAASKRPRKKGFVGWLTHRHDPLTSLLLTVPVFLLYHLGILLPFVRMQNGVDFVSAVMFQLLQQSMLGYVALTLGYAVAIGGAVFFLRKKGSIRPTEWLPMLGESAILAVLMSLLVGWATHQLFDAQVGGTAMNPVEKLVMAAGAGFHEELIFRVVFFAGGTWALSKALKVAEWKAAVIAALVSSLVFSGVHYVGSMSDDFSLVSFTFRALAGLYLAAVYRFRGFAVAVYTHAIYDVIVFFV